MLSILSLCFVGFSDLISGDILLILKILSQVMVCNNILSSGSFIIIVRWHSNILCYIQLSADVSRVIKKTSYSWTKSSSKILWKYVTVIFHSPNPFPDAMSFIFQPGIRGLMIFFLLMQFPLSLSLRFLFRGRRYSAFISEFAKQEREERGVTKWNGKGRKTGK